MSPSEPTSAASPDPRLEALEKAVRDLRARVARLEKLMAPRQENRKDQTVVQSKVVYDWQK